MKIISAEYIKSFTSVRNNDLPTLPAIAFSGRSNVGKSSLINHLLLRRKLVKTSGTPGKTQLINIFLINSSFYFIDLPGYGFANVPLRVKEDWKQMINDFLFDWPNLRATVQLVDIRHRPSQLDLDFKDLIKKAKQSHIVVANKSDKLNKKGISKQLKEIKDLLGLQKPPLLHSTLQKTGREEIWTEINAYLNN